MGLSQIEAHPALTAAPVVIRANEATASIARSAFESNAMFVVDAFAWPCDLAVLAAGCGERSRKFKDPFSHRKPSTEESKQIEALAAAADRLYRELFPRYNGDFHGPNWRPMKTQKEPIHFDSHDMGANPFMTAYVNIASTFREYAVSYDLAQLFEACPREMADIMRSIKGKARDLSRAIRARSERDEPPLDRSAPRHVLKLAPGAIWFFNTKTVSHEVVYGDGAVGLSWTIANNATVPTQETIIAAVPA